MRLTTLVVWLALCGAVIGLAACGDGGGGDTSTDSDADSDTDTDSDSDPECTSGDCCDVETQSFQPSTFSCASATEYACDGDGCGAIAQQRTVTTYCSGASATCNGSVSNGAWSTIEDCGSDQPCETDGASYAECGAVDVGGCCAVSGNWYDPATELCWQNPPSDDDFTWADAVSYCDSLSLGGFDDWRLPMIQELISLLRGCVGGTETGDLSTSECGVTDPDCLEHSCWDTPACNYCDALAGPDDAPDGCYWDPALAGICYWYWSSSSWADDVSSTWYVTFDGGNVHHWSKSNSLYARCVRGGP